MSVVPVFLWFMQDILVAPFSGVIDAFLECTLEMRYRFGATPEPHTRAKVISTSLARPTVVTRDPDLEGDALANLETCDGGTHGNYNPSRLVA